jgi:hypothetical protein
MLINLKKFKSKVIYGQDSWTGFFLHIEDVMECTKVGLGTDGERFQGTAYKTAHHVHR